MHRGLGGMKTFNVDRLPIFLPHRIADRSILCVQPDRPLRAEIEQHQASGVRRERHQMTTVRRPTRAEQAPRAWYRRNLLSRAIEYLDFKLTQIQPVRGAAKRDSVTVRGPVRVVLLMVLR